MQFMDLNPELTPFQRRYVTQIKRCDEIERKIRYVHSEVKKMEVPVQPAGSVEHFVDSALGSEATSGSYLLENLESKLESYENQLLDLNKYSNKLTDEYNGKVEFHHVLIRARKLFSGEASAIDAGDAGSSFNPLLSAASIPAAEYQTDRELAFSNIAGVLASTDKVRFERMLFRATRGNCYVRFADIDGKVTDAAGNAIPKVVFIIFYKSTAIEGKIKKICDGFSAHRYDLQALDKPRDLEAQQQANYREMQDAKLVLDKNTETRLRLCVEIAKNVEEWLWVVRREKSTYATLNQFKNDVAGNLLRGRGWILTDTISKARAALNRAHASLNLPPSAILERVHGSWPSPPTHFRTNKYTDSFQEFVNTYGVPRYQEANPALFTMATFPFLFGVMYGDIGHGFCLMLAGFFLILTESNADSRSLGEMMKGVYSARYMLFAMGCMAMYAGSIYNDYFSVGLNLFGSNFHYNVEEAGAPALMRSNYGDASRVYPYGVDPAWKISGNELLFYNSMKMKMSVILGIFQMTFGLVLRGVNALYFRNYLDFFAEFVPMIIFAVAFFGYMVVLIFVKWSINWDQRMAMGTCGYDAFGTFGACALSDTVTSCFTYAGKVCTKNTLLADKCPLGMGGLSNGCQPPNIITTLINMALKPGTVEEPIYSGQASVQVFLLLLAFFTVPVLLCVKPAVLRYQHNKHLKETASIGGGHVSSNPLLAGHGSDSNDDEDHQEQGGGHGGGDHGHGGEFNFGEIAIHQAIETIEFVLGMVSNTASYLRLWALSLAHTELATVFWEKAMVSAISTNNPVLIFMGYAVFAGVTFAVLLAMDVLECFLHALRLHWVEFQGKFYKADGYRFQPFDFKAVLGRAILE
jgi:V-type H+-transporting ATPase subunit a